MRSAGIYTARGGMSRAGFGKRSVAAGESQLG
jgi:hypothetical protein